jgi:hypothetical protein
MTIAMTIAPTNVTTSPERLLGEYGTDGTGNTYIYVKGGESITQYATCLIDENFNILMSTATLTTPGTGAGKAVCVPQVAIASGSYGWALIKGTGTVLGAASCVKWTELTVTATSGVLDDATTAGLEVINNIAFDTTLTGAAATTCVMNFPNVGRTL